MNNKITEIKDEHARVEQLYKDDPTKIDKLDQAHGWFGYLLQLVETQSKALEFYADKENYRGYYTAGGYWKAPANDDDGLKAREALSII